MTEREALKLALEALKYPLNQSHENFNVDMAELLAHRAITAIKEALAQPEHEWVRGECVKCGQSMEQPEQEPVAILHRYPSKCRMTVEYTDEITEVREGSWPLYTTPPQSKPLTDEEIILIVAECAASHQHTDIHFARAIERAHGIKELV